jgi:hypothetical protein
LDGKHFRIKCPSKARSLLYRYKQYSSSFLLAIADAHCAFICRDVGACGEGREISVSQNSAFGEAVLNYVSVMNVPGGEFKFPHSDTETPPVNVVDEAFPLRRNLMTRYPGENFSSDRRLSIAD